MNNKSQIIKNNAKGVTTKVLTTLNKPKNIKIISYVLLALVFLGIVGYQYIFDLGLAIFASSLVDIPFERFYHLVGSPNEVRNCLRV